MAENNTNASCTTCHKHASDADGDLKKCGVCLTTQYCSVECQKADWASHKANCTILAVEQLIEAVKSNDEETVRRLAQTKRVLNGKVDHVELTGDGDPRVFGKWTALHECVRSNNAGMMEVLIENGAMVDIKDAGGETPIFVASTSNNPVLVQTLLRAGANPNALAKDGWSCLMMAVRDAHYEVTKALLGAGANPYGATDMFGRTALDLVTFMGSGKGAMRISSGETYEQARSKYGGLRDLFVEYGYDI